MKKTIALAALLAGVAAAGAWLYWGEPRPPAAPAVSPEKKLEQSLRLQNFKARGYYYLSRKNDEDALMFFKMAAELDPDDKSIEEVIRQLETPDASSSAP